jgi:hypothetical protein
LLLKRRLPNMVKGRRFHEIGIGGEAVENCCGAATADALLQCGKVKKRGRTSLPGL